MQVLALSFYPNLKYCKVRTSDIPVPTRIMLCKGSTSLAHLSREPIFDKTIFLISPRLESRKGVAERENAIVGVGTMTCPGSDSSFRSIAIRRELSSGSKS